MNGAAVIGSNTTVPVTGSKDVVGTVNDDPEYNPVPLIIRKLLRYPVK
jgi:hypothetical protein